MRYGDFLRDVKKDAMAAIGQYRQVLIWRPDDAEALGNLATSLLATGRLDEAEAMAERAVAVAPQLGHSRRTRALVRFERGRYAEALADLDAAIAADPQDAMALGNRANTRLYLDDYAGALADCDAALALQPDDPMLLANRATLHVMQGHPEDGERDAVRALARHPDHVVALAAGGLAARALGRWETAAERFRRFLAVAPPADRRRPSVRTWLAEVEERLR